MKTIYRDCQDYSGRKSSIRANQIVQVVMKRVKKTANQVGISKSSMHKIFFNYLRFTAYKKQSRQLVASKQKRHNRGKKMLAEIQSTFNHVFIRSDKKIFTVEAVTNTQNDRLYAHDAGYLPEGNILM